MRQSQCWLLAICVVFGLASTALNAAPVPAKPDEILIVYFSRSGNTRTIAHFIQKHTGGTLFELEPVDAYPAGYDQTVIRSREEIEEKRMVKLRAMPEMSARYKVVFVGTPSWWRTIAPPVTTYLAQGRLAGKVVIPFITHGGGGHDLVGNAVRTLVPKGKITAPGAFAGRNIEAREPEVIRWLATVIVVDFSHRAAPAKVPVR
ncbi:MAG: flavodoxin [Victivallaceae bacterium]|nr:flavodoxin [Victivallaceae bacterium]